MVAVGNVTLIDLWQLPPSLAISFDHVRKVVKGGRKSQGQRQDGTVTLTSFTTLDTTTRPASWVMVDMNKVSVPSSSSEGNRPIVERPSLIELQIDEDMPLQVAQHEEGSSSHPQNSEPSTHLEDDDISSHHDPDSVASSPLHYPENVESLLLPDNVASLPLHDPENVESLPLPRLQSVESTLFPRAANSLDSDPNLSQENYGHFQILEEAVVDDYLTTEDGPSRFPFVAHTKEHSGSSPILSQRTKSFELVKPDNVESSPLPAKRTQILAPCLETPEMADDSYPPTPEDCSFPPTPNGSSNMLTAEDQFEVSGMLAESTVSIDDISPLQSALFGLVTSHDGTPSFTQSTSNIEPEHSFVHQMAQTSDPLQVIIPVSSEDSFASCHLASSDDSVSISHPASSDDSFATCDEAPTPDVHIPVPFQKKCCWLEEDALSAHPTQNVIGDGSFSTVHVMQHGNKDVVVKIFKNDAPLDIEAVLAEADTAAYMGAFGIGPALVGLVKPSKKKRLPAIVMEHMPGAQDMFTLISTHRQVPRSDLLDMLKQATRLIGVLHDRGFIHNDVKITNFLVVANPLQQGLPEQKPIAPGSVTGCITSSSRYRLYLIDFGQTTFNHGAIFDMDEQTLSCFKQFPYLPPEVVAGAPTAVTTDVYSFGMSMSMMTDMLCMQSLTADLTPLITRCCHPDPLCRPSMVELEQALAALKSSPHTTRCTTRRLAVARRRLSVSRSRSTSTEESSSTGPEDFSIKCIKKFTNTLSDPSSSSSADSFPLNRTVVTFGEVVSDWKLRMAKINHSDTSSDTTSDRIHSTPDVDSDSSDDTSTSFEVIAETSGEASTTTGDSGVHMSSYSDIVSTDDNICHSDNDEDKEVEDKGKDAFCVDEDLFVSGFVSEPSSMIGNSPQSMPSSREISPMAAADAVHFSLLAAACAQATSTSTIGPLRSLTHIERLTSGNSSLSATMSAELISTSCHRAGTFIVHDQSQICELVVEDVDEEDEVFVSWPHIFSRSTAILPIQCTWRWLETKDILPASIDPKDALSDGTFAWVYRMCYKNRDVIVKVCKSNGQSDMEMMIREADMATLLGTYGVGPSITGVLHCGPGSDLPAIVMEYLPEAQDLLNLIEDRVSINRLDLLEIFLQAARLLSFIHQRHFIHNDVKLTNILVVPNGSHQFAYPSPEGATGCVTSHCRYRVYLIDFGQTSFERGAIYKLDEEEMEEFEQYPYLPPEVLGGEPTAPTSDVYAFGMAMELATSVLYGDSLSEELQSLMGWCTHVDKGQRPTMEQVECSLQHLLHGHLVMPPLAESDISDSDASDDIDDADDEEDDDDDGGDPVAPPIDYGLQAGEGAGELHEQQPGPVAIGSSGEGSAAFEGVLPAGLQRAHPSLEDIASFSDSGEDTARGFMETHLRRASRNILQLQCSPQGIRTTMSSHTLHSVPQPLSTTSIDSETDYHSCFEEEVD